MDAKLSPPSARGRRPWAIPRWTLVVFGLLIAGTLIQACSDNNGTTGPTFNGTPAPTTGFANTSADILIRVSANPASIEPGRRVTITVTVTNGASALGGSGQPLAGKRVLVNTSTTGPAFGTVDQPTGTTDSNGVYTTTMIVRCSDAGVTTAAAGDETGTATTIVVTVDAFVDGASSALSGTSAIVTITGTSDNPPCPGSA